MLKTHVNIFIFLRFCSEQVRGQPKKSLNLYFQGRYFILGQLFTIRNSSGNNIFLFSKKMQATLKVQDNIGLQEMLGGEGHKIGCWSGHQNLLYCIFVDQNKSVMISKNKRKKMRIFEVMSKFVGSRNSLQCRSHHQKFVEKFGDIKQIVGAFKKFFGIQCYKENYRVYTGKKARCAQCLKPLCVKSKENEPLNKQPQISAENDCEKVSQQAVQEQPSQKRKGDGLEAKEKTETHLGPCKVEQLLEFYIPYSYYIASSFIPYPFFTQLYSLQDTQ